MGDLPNERHDCKVSISKAWASCFPARDVIASLQLPTIYITGPGAMI